MKSSHRYYLAGPHQPAPREARVIRIESERDRAHQQAENAAIILLASFYTHDVDRLQVCIGRALSALGYDADNEGELTVPVAAYVANELR